jgi:hypothetical protein
VAVAPSTVAPPVNSRNDTSQRHVESWENWATASAVGAKRRTRAANVWAHQLDCKFFPVCRYTMQTMPAHQPARQARRRTPSAAPHLRRQRPRRRLPVRSETPTFIRQISAQVARAVPYVTGCSTRRAGPRRAVLPPSPLPLCDHLRCSPVPARLLLASVGAPALPRRPASPSAPTGSAPTGRAASIAQSTRLLASVLSSDLVAYWGFV